MKSHETDSSRRFPTLSVQVLAGFSFLGCREHAAPAGFPICASTASPVRTSLPRQLNESDSHAGDPVSKGDRRGATGGSKMRKGLKYGGTAQSAFACAFPEGRGDHRALGGEGERREETQVRRRPDTCPAPQTARRSVAAK